MIKAIYSLLLCLSALSLASCDEVFDDDINQYRDRKREVRQKRNEIEQALKEPIITNTLITVLSEDGDTIAVRNEISDSANVASLRRITYTMPSDPVHETDYVKMKLMVIMTCCIVFIPFLAIIIITILIFRHIASRTRQRNALIEKAIENNYTLPSAFFGMVAPEVHNVYNYTNSLTPPPFPSASGNSTEEKGLGNATAQPQAAADPTTQPNNYSTLNDIRLVAMSNEKKFNRAITLIAIGFSIGLFFMIAGSPEMACIAGLTLILIGAASLVSMFFLRR